MNIILLRPPRRARPKSARPPRRAAGRAPGAPRPPTPRRLVSVRAFIRRNCERLMKTVIAYLMVILTLTWITVVILELIHAPKPDFLEGLYLLVAKPTQAPPAAVGPPGAPGMPAAAEAPAAEEESTIL